MVDAARARRIAERIKVVLGQNLESTLKDSRLGFVTITDVRVTGDLQHASVFYTVLGDEQQVQDSVAAIENGKGRLRSIVGRALQIRLTPTLEFVPDALPGSAKHVEDLLRTVQEQDASLAAARARAQYAGDADPYRKPHTEAVEDESADEPAPEGTDAPGGRGDVGGVAGTGPRD